LKEQVLFKAQLRAILRASVDKDVSILFPMISTLSELREAKRMLQEMKEELNLFHPIRVGCMVEVPSAALIVDHFVKECDFLSIGTNDLVQYALAIDRSEQAWHECYEPTDPSVIRLIKLVTSEANKAQIPVSVCGEIASDPRFTALLLGLGIQELSVAPRYLPIIKNAIRRTSIVDAVQLELSA
jgi:phosphotransferase system enzyme I (PtsI)